jgi:8-oxo-dGTP pyrophosphatase MutT (NUDIX family)
VVLSLRRAGYRLAYRLLWLAAFARPPRGQGAKALVRHDGEVLLVVHTYGPRRWELPGGGVKRGEEPRAAILRELEEELGLHGATPTRLATVNGSGRQSRHRTHLFSVESDVALARIDPVEIAQARWCDPAALPRPLGSMVREALEIAGLSPPHPSIRDAGKWGAGARE